VRGDAVARERRRSKRGGGWQRHPLEDLVQLECAEEVDLIDLEEALGELARLDPRQAEVVELRFFGGLTMPEAAEVLGVSLATAEREWASARAWLAFRLSGRDA
jgi:RNA polymerase sigma-70 factor (ECF subfamily)